MKFNPRLKEIINKLIGKMHINIIVVVVILINTIIVLTITATVLLSKYNESNKNMAIQNTKQATENIAKSIDSFVNEKIENIYWIKSVMEKNDSSEYDKALKTIIELNSDVVMASIYNEDGKIIYAQSQIYQEIKQNYVKSDLTFKSIKNKTLDKYYISMPHVNNIYKLNYPWVFTIATEAKMGKENVYIVMDVKFNKISQYIDKIYIGNKGYVYISDNNGNMVYHPQQKLLYTKIKNERFDILKELYGMEYIITDSNIYSFSSLNNVKWKIIGVSNLDEMVTKRTNEFIQYVMFVLAIILLSSILLVCLLFSSLTRPMSKLIKAMREFEIDVNTCVEQKNFGVKEICELQNSFNHMSYKIKNLMEKVVSEEKELRKFELKALQSQINPHFLYNTLDSIYWLCEEDGNKDAANMVSALSNTFRISISRGNDEISIKDEIKHVTSYLIIQNFRYKGQFKYSFQIEDNVLNLKCLKILLQPFVENAIYHGLDRFVDEGEILIKGYKNEKFVFFEVVDNGVGMDKEQIEQLYKKNNEKTGIGVKNVHDRIQIYYGDIYGVSIESELDEGTRVIIKIPIVNGD